MQVGAYKDKVCACALQVWVVYSCSCRSHMSIHTHTCMLRLTRDFIRPMQQKELNDRQAAMAERRPVLEQRTEKKSRDVVINHLFEMFRLVFFVFDRTWMSSLCGTHAWFVSLCVCFCGNVRVHGDAEC